MGYELKTQLNDANVSDYLAGIEDHVIRDDCFVLLDMFSEISDEEPKMWGDAIVGFGSYSYESKSGCNGNWMRIAFSPRKNYISIYIMPGYHDFFGLLENLGKHKAGKSCLNIKKLDDIDFSVLRQLVEQGWEKMNELYPN